jgi:hypothetical protein
MGADFSGVRPSLFADVGDVGDRTRIMRPSSAGRPLSGVGTGVAFGDGLVRVDLARGIYPRKQWRIEIVVDAPL